MIPLAAINALLPLFLDDPHSAAMIRHSVDIVRAAVHYLNPGQVPALAADHSLYALAKEVQWKVICDYFQINLNKYKFTILEVSYIKDK